MSLARDPAPLAHLRSLCVLRRLRRLRRTRVGSSTHPLETKKGPARGPFLVWRRGWDGFASLGSSPFRGRAALRRALSASMLASVRTRWVRPHTPSRQKKAPRGAFLVWRRGWDGFASLGSSPFGAAPRCVALCRPACWPRFEPGGFVHTPPRDKKRPREEAFSCLAERVGFEPTDGTSPSLDFESSPFDHSGTSPGKARIVVEAFVGRQSRVQADAGLQRHRGDQAEELRLCLRRDLSLSISLS